MVLVAPDILDEVRQLPWYLLAFAAALGLLLWLVGGRGHRFWLVLCMTLTGGVFGLSFGAAYGVQPLVAGLLVGVAAGALALALARVVLFILGGAACVWLAHAVAPAWDEPALCFLAGGLVGVLLYKVWVTALSSLAGTLLLAYSILGLLGRLAGFDAVAWAGEQTAVLNWACGALAVLGLLAQLLLERRRVRRRREQEKARKEAEERAREQPPPPPPPPPRHWWEWGSKKGPRRAA
jgi:MFS family permease